MSTDGGGTIGGPFEGGIGSNLRFEDAWSVLGVNRLGWDCPDDQMQPLRTLLVQMHLGCFDEPDEEGLRDCRKLLAAVEMKWVILNSRASAEAFMARLNGIISAAEIAKETGAVVDEVKENLPKLLR